MSINLQGLHVLVVEDEYLIAVMIVETLEKAGCTVIGPESELDAALQSARRVKIDGGLLDINVGGELVFPLAEQLDENNVPFVFLTGYGRTTMPDRFRGRPFVSKPFLPHVLLQTLKDATRSDGQAV
jgi:DNA-binding response OmpR family regulator